jgi:hypothetical protein
MNPEFFQALRKRDDFTVYLSEHKVVYREKPNIGGMTGPSVGVEFEVGDEHWLAYFHRNGNFERLVWI